MSVSLAIRAVWVAAALVVGVADDGGASGSDGRILVSPAAHVSGDRILLGEMGSLSGHSVRLEGVDLGAAPPPGASRRIRGERILSVLREAGLDEDRETYRIPASVRIIRRFQEIEAEELRDHVRHWLVEDQGVAASAIERVQAPHGARVALAPYRLEVEPLPGSGRLRKVEVRVRQGDGVPARVPVTVLVRERASVVVARRGMGRGHVVTAGDVGLETRDVLASTREVAHSLDEVMGRIADVPIGAGSVVSTRKLREPAIVRKGDAVRAWIESDGLSVSVPVQALESGPLGGAVRVVNPSSGRELVGRVVAHGKVRVAY